MENKKKRVICGILAPCVWILCGVIAGVLTGNRVPFPPMILIIIAGLRGINRQKACACACTQRCDRGLRLLCRDICIGADHEFHRAAPYGTVTTRILQI